MQAGQGHGAYVGSGYSSVDPRPWPLFLSVPGMDAMRQGSHRSWPPAQCGMLGGGCGDGDTGWGPGQVSGCDCPWGLRRATRPSQTRGGAAPADSLLSGWVPWV